MCSDSLNASLPELFAKAQTAVEQLQLPTHDLQAHTRLAQDVLACLTRAASLVDALGVFSSNESFDDLATADIKYVLIPYYQAETLVNARYESSTARIAALTSACSLYDAFLARAQQYGLLSAGARKCIASLVELRRGEGSITTGSPNAMDRTSLRELKIERFKLEKKAQARAEVLSRYRRGHGTAEGDEEDSEGIEREYYVLLVELTALKAAEALSSLRRELELLQQAGGLVEVNENNTVQHASPSSILEELRRASSALRATSMTGHKEQLRNEVFRPSHLMPRISVEEQGIQEMRALGLRERAAQETKAAQAVARAAMLKEDIEDDDVRRHRAQDDWKDDNPRGWGNSRLRPCG